MGETCWRSAPRPGGAGAGRLAALKLLASQFPADHAAVLVTIHLRHPSILDEILAAAGPLPAAFAKDGEAVEKRRIYIAPPERHLLLYGEHLLGDGLGKLCRSRPRSNVPSAAVCCGAWATGVILSGSLGDGALGLLALKGCGGIVVVQDPCDADYLKCRAQPWAGCRPIISNGCPEWRTYCRSSSKSLPVPRGRSRTISNSKWKWRKLGQGPDS